MSVSRLATALEQGMFDLSASQVRVVRPTVDYDLSPLAREAVQIDTGIKPDADAFARAGFAVSDAPCPVTIVVVPRSKTFARALVAEAAQSSDLVIVDGQKTDGVDSVFKEIRKRIGDLPSVTKGHGRLFAFGRTDAFADWRIDGPVQGAHGYWTHAGVYSDGAVDHGSALLAQALPAKLPARIADFGAGWGYLAAEALRREGVQSVDLIESEALSLDCARLNVADDRAAFHWADVTTYDTKAAYDAIIMNPPFHQGRKGDPSLGQAFIRSAARNLKSNGQLWMVANRHLPYEAALTENFRTVDEIGGDSRFKLFHATRPKG